MSEPQGIRLELPASVLDELVERTAALVLERMPAPAEASPYLSVSEAAEYLRCSKQRVYDLLSMRRLTKLRDGSRVLLDRAELDAYLRGVAPLMPPTSGRPMNTRKAA